MLCVLSLQAEEMSSRKGTAATCQVDSKGIFQANQEVNSAPHPASWEGFLGRNHTPFPDPEPLGPMAPWPGAQRPLRGGEEPELRLPQPDRGVGLSVRPRGCTEMTLGGGSQRQPAPTGREDGGGAD